MQQKGPRLATMAAHLVQSARCQECGEGHPADDPRARNHWLATYQIEPSDRGPVLRADGRCAHGHALTARFLL
jgi:hypothetical protein